MNRHWWVVGLVGEVLFSASWLVAGAWQGPGYQPLRDDISEMGALTAPWAWLYLLPQAAAGLAVFGFAVFGLRPALRDAGTPGRVGPWFAALSALQDLTDAAFRLDCRSADGCTAAQTTASWHGKLHAATDLIWLLLLIGAPFVLARAFKRLPEWRSLAEPSRWVGLLVVGGLIATTLPKTIAIHGALQRAVALVAAVWGVALALRLRSTATHAPAFVS